MISSLTSQLDVDVLIAVRDGTAEARQRMRREAGKVARGTTAQLTVRELSTEPDKPDLPIRWTSARQRRAVMAKLRRARMIPYQRSHRQSRGWTSVLDTLTGGNGGVIVFENRNPVSEFIQGEFQQRYLSKWPLARLVIRSHEEALQDELIDAWGRALGVK